MVKRVFIATFLSVLLSCTALAQVRNPNSVGQYDIRGRLLFSTAKPPEDRIEINLERNMQRLQTVFSDSVGNFEFRSVPPGDYFVNVRLPDYEDVNQSVNVLPTQRTTNIVIQMNALFMVRRTRAAGFEGDDPDVIDVKMIAKTYPKKAVQAYQKAIDESKKGHLDVAAKLLEEAVSIAPDFYHAQNNLGVAYMKLNRFSEAGVAYRHAIELNPKAEQPLLNLGILYITESDARQSEDPEIVGKLLDDALDSLESAIKLKPRSSMSHFYLGMANYKSGFYSEAEVALKKAAELDPAMGNVHLLLVNVYVKERRLPDALQEIDTFIRDNPKAPERPSLEEMRAKIVKGISPNQK